MAIAAETDITAVKAIHRNGWNFEKAGLGAETVTWGVVTGDCGVVGMNWGVAGADTGTVTLFVLEIIVGDESVVEDG